MDCKWKTIRRSPHSAIVVDGFDIVETVVDDSQDRSFGEVSPVDGGPESILDNVFPVCEGANGSKISLI